MVDLYDCYPDIEHFLVAGIKKYTAVHGKPLAIGIYCRPQNGWISLNFNKTKTLEEAGNNCPDFEFVEFDLVDFKDWEDENESETPMWENSKGDRFEPNDLTGDEDLNEFIFDYLLCIITEQKIFDSPQTVLLQMLDSNCCATFHF